MTDRLRGSLHLRCGSRLWSSWWAHHASLLRRELRNITSSSLRHLKTFVNPIFMRHHLQFEQWVPHPVERVFSFFANPDNLPPLMPAWQKARIDAATILAPASRPPQHRLTVAAGEGTRMTISFRPLPLSPVRMRWEARIAEFAWDDHFCDEQLSGPFGYWLHCHRVRAEVRDGVAGTSITDDVTYAMKFGPLGEVANLLGGEMQMRSLFHYRQRQLLKLLAVSA